MKEPFENDFEYPPDDLYLTDLISVETLQKMQDAFSAMARMAALTTDAAGVAVTKGSNFSRFCMEFCRKSEIGRKRCEFCDINGAKMALEKNAPVSYYCHANLVDFAAPIMLRGKVIGSFIGGQVLPELPDLEKMRHIANEIQVDEEEFIRAAKETNIVSKEEIDRATNFIYSFAQIISDIAYKAYKAKILSEKAKRAATAKGDFLANMSHEIRTPMNAVLGMASIALREELPPNARTCIKQIQTSGQLLLTIINDILDFSKIESGKLEIVADNYEPFSLVNDLSNIVVTKIGDKNIEFLVDINPEIPRLLYGDSIRVKQIITNLANNAVKFTNEGKVCLHIDYEKISDSNIINLKCSVEDTGIGIKDEDKAKIFQSFQQLDTKRNRNIEGTGLGLVISKNLVSLMNGELSFKSEYGKGSAFSFSIPQKVIDFEPCFHMDGERYNCGIISGNVHFHQQLINDLKKLGQNPILLDQFALTESKEKIDLDFIFVKQPYFSNKLQNFAREHPNIKFIVIVALGADRNYGIENVKTLQKPVYVMNLASVLKNIDIDLLVGSTKKEDLFFTAPDAEILVVDDNETNIMVVKGLLEPLKMKIDSATSGKECIEKIQKKKYDIVFMDHMMPVMDGAETTDLIRHNYHNYDDVPIIALTANVVAETKTMFTKVGMNDFVPKPIEVKVIVPAIKRWLPHEKIHQDTEEQIAEKEQAHNLRQREEAVQIKNLNTTYALKLFGGNTNAFWQALKSWYKLLPKKIDSIKTHKNSEQWDLYTIEVHAMKSASRQVGAIALSDLAAKLEAAGNEQDIDYILAKTDEMISCAENYLPILAPYFNEESEINDDERPLASREVIADCLDGAKDAFENLNLVAAEEVCNVLEKYKFSEKENKLFDKLKEAVTNIDMTLGEQIVAEWRACLC